MLYPITRAWHHEKAVVRVVGVECVIPAAVGKRLIELLPGANENGIRRAAILTFVVVY